MNAKLTGDKSVHFSVRLPANLNRYLTRRAKLEVRSKNQLLIKIIMDAKKADMAERGE